ncbi:hypothetical protein HDF08_003164 [Edaphobacter lichenicola]|uniref:Uncharacterized protein n=1 Tax=Tunturiibacter lichenicola TaxID=2051959 RepID=A0A852VNW3_9BACT|nr:hypothetical protein [Edaphobacter lichenicola]
MVETFGILRDAQDDGKGKGDDKTTADPLRA